MSSSERTRAYTRASRLYGGAGYRGAYVNGAVAAAAGATKDSNPYSYAPGSAGYYRAWDAGFASVTAEEYE